MVLACSDFIGFVLIYTHSGASLAPVVALADQDWQTIQIRRTKLWPLIAALVTTSSAYQQEGVSRGPLTLLEYHTKQQWHFWSTSRRSCLPLSLCHSWLSTPELHINSEPSPRKAPPPRLNGRASVRIQCCPVMTDISSSDTRSTSQITSAPSPENTPSTRQDRSETLERFSQQADPIAEPPPHPPPPGPL